MEPVHVASIKGAGVPLVWSTRYTLQALETMPGLYNF